MKRSITMIAMLLATAALTAQTIVSTEQSNRNVIIEEYTGIGCGYCPDGHAVANQICQQYEGHAWAINIHQGGYASGSGYETQWGDSLASQYNIQGYPCGTTNRCPGMQNRGQWAATAAAVRNAVSPVNVAATATIDPNTRQMAIHVELFYTGNQTATSNFLSVAILQNNVIGPQSNYGNPNPYNAEYVTADGKYRHMHMLRDMINGPWGEQITTLDSGTFIEKDYVYNIPFSIGTVSIEDFNDLEVLAFVSETHKNILSGNKAEMSILPALYVSGTTIESSDCSLDFRPYIKISNTYGEDVTSFDVMYDGVTFTVNKTIASGADDTVTLPRYTVVPDGSRTQYCGVTKSASIVSAIFADGDTLEVNSDPIDILLGDMTIYTVSGSVVARLGVDAWRKEAGVQVVRQSDCSVMFERNSMGTNVSYNQQSPISQFPNATFYNVNVNPAAPGIYILRVLDSYGDGWRYTNNNVKSGLWISDAQGEFVTMPWGYANGPEFSEIDFYLNVTSADGDGTCTLGINDSELENISFSIYPNPVSDRLVINAPAALREVSVLDITGRTVLTSAVNTIDVSSLAAGVYMVRVATENGMGVEKFVKE